MESLSAHNESVNAVDDPLLSLSLSEHYNLLITAIFVILMVLPTFTRRFFFSGLMMDGIAAAMIISTTFNRSQLVSEFPKSEIPQQSFTEYCLVSWLGSIILESRAIYFIIKMLWKIRRWNFDIKSHLTIYYATASASLLVFQYSTYIHRFLGEAQDHVMITFLLTAFIEAGKILIQGPLLCKLLFPNYLQFSHHSRHLYPALLRLAFINLIFLVNSVLLLFGLTNFSNKILLFEPSWTFVHYCIMTIDIVTRLLSTYYLFGCYLYNLKNDKKFVWLRVMVFRIQMLYQTLQNLFYGNNDMPPLVRDDSEPHEVLEEPALLQEILEEPIGNLDEHYDYHYDTVAALPLDSILVCQPAGLVRNHQSIVPTSCVYLPYSRTDCIVACSNIRRLVLKENSHFVVSTKLKG